MTIENLRWLYQINDSVTKVNLEDITPEEASRRPEPTGNSIAWILGHILRSRSYLLKFMDIEWSPGEEFLKAVARGSSGDLVAGTFPDFARELALWNESQELLMKAFDALSDDKLGRDTPPLGDFARPDTLERRILFLYFHEVYHLGQFGLLRRLLGKEGAIR